MQESKENNIVSAFVHEWALSVVARSVLHIKESTFNLYPNLHNLITKEVDTAQDIPKNTLYDLILGDLPLGMKTVNWRRRRKTINTQQNWLEILKSLVFLESNGYALFLLEPMGFSTDKGIAFEKELNERGFFVNAFINLPPKILEPYTVLVPVLVVISTKKTDKLFVAELLDDGQARQVTRAYFSNINEGNLIKGKYIDAKDYFGFNRIKISEQIERLETQYKTYEKQSLSDLAVEINHARSGEQFQERDNSIYIPLIGTSQVVCKLEDAKLKHHNYFQVVLRNSVLNEYIASFFRSALGRLIIDSLTSKTYVPHLNKKGIEHALVAVPKLYEQKTIVQTQNKLQILKSAIDRFDSELALNPTSSSSILGQLDLMLSAIDSLTDADKIRSIVREGESKYIEFKETFSLDIKKQTKESYIEDSALKTVVAFLNTDGGILLIGVSDDGQIAGIDTEIGKYYKNMDKFLLHWKNNLKERIGEQFYQFIEYRAIKVDNKYVLFVECKPSQMPCFLDKKFYVRTNPATDKLEGPQLIEYIKYHFK